MATTKTRKQGDKENKMKTSSSLLVWLACYIVLIGIVVWSLMAARRWALAELATPKAVSAWQKWRDDVRREQTEPSPVRRRVPKSDEPPALVLMRDYFEVCLVGAILFSSVLYWVIAWLVSGMLTSVGGIPHPSE
jgi:hypothetical protein